MAVSNLQQVSPLEQVIGRRSSLPRQILFPVARWCQQVNEERKPREVLTRLRLTEMIGGSHFQSHFIINRNNLVVIQSAWASERLGKAPGPEVLNLVSTISPSSCDTVVSVESRSCQTETLSEVISRIAPGSPFFVVSTDVKYPSRR